MAGSRARRLYRKPRSVTAAKKRYKKGVEALKNPSKWLEEHKDDPIVNAILTQVPGASAASIAKAVADLRVREAKRMKEEKDDISRSTRVNSRLQSLSSIESALHGAARANVKKDIAKAKSELQELATREAERNRQSQYDYTRMYQAGNLPAGFISETLNSIENNIKGDVNNAQ